VHNATYQGVTPIPGGGYATLDSVQLPGEKLFFKYFEHFDRINLMKGAILKVHESGGRVTTVSGDLDGTWGYAAELRQSHASLLAQAAAQKGGPPLAVLVPNGHLDLFEKVPVAGITNGLSGTNRPERLPELRASELRRQQRLRGPARPLFRHPMVQAEMLARDHTYDADRLEVRAGLKRLLHLEAFGEDPRDDPVLLTVVGRLVAQKNLGLVAEVAERALALDPGVKLVVLASAPRGDPEGRAVQGAFAALAAARPDRVLVV